MTPPIIAAQLGAALLILQLVLMLTVGVYRVKIGQFIGVGEDPHMIRRIRRHGNLAENAALFLIVLALAELIGLSASVLGWLAALFFIARLSHAVSFSSLGGSHGDGPKLFAMLRIVGAMGTALTGFGLAIYLLVSLLLG